MTDLSSQGIKLGSDQEYASLELFIMVSRNKMFLNITIPISADLIN